jgi:hypothetical protein
MSHSEMVISSIDPSPLASEEELMTFQVGPQDRLEIIILVVCNEFFSKMAKLKTPRDM